VNPATPGPHAPEGAPPLRVLCVDDNRDAADSTADLLRTVEFEARACYDGPGALTEAAAFRCATKPATPRLIRFCPQRTTHFF